MTKVEIIPPKHDICAYCVLPKMNWNQESSLDCFLWAAATLFMAMEMFASSISIELLIPPVFSCSDDRVVRLSMSPICEYGEFVKMIPSSSSLHLGLSSDIYSAIALVSF